YATGIDPHVVAIGSRGLVAVGNAGSNDVWTFDIDRNGNMDFLASYPLGASPRTLAFSPDGHELFVGTRLIPNPTGAEDRILAFKVEPDLNLSFGGTTPAGNFLTELKATRDGVVAATVGKVGGIYYDQVRAYARTGTQLDDDAALEIGAPPS